MCKTSVISIKKAILLSAVALIISACGSDSVTNGNIGTSPPKQQTGSNVPDAQVLLTQLPEMRATVFFPTKQYELTPNEYLLIDPIAVRLRQHPDSYVLIVGHGDDFSSEEENIALSYERAFTAAIYISSVFGIEEERIQIIAAGSSEPHSENPNEQNKRVEVISPKGIVRTLNPNGNQNF
ncbi:OmpA family protein [Photobacterium minamisatsumaniensis]|uniref:OmpA family protein n=1 Tax=Photobacterium minamisatsumaniensis TaxID=2910233 RepID=UPI003D131145